MQLTAEMPTLNIKALIKVNILTKFIKRGWFINLLGICRGDGDGKKLKRNTGGTRF